VGLPSSIGTGAARNRNVLPPSRLAGRLPFRDITRAHRRPPEQQEELRMRLIKALVALTLVAVALTARPSAQTSGAAPAVPGQILVKFRPGASAAAKTAAHRAEGGRPLNEIARTGVQLVAVQAGDETGAINRYRRNPNVVYAEPNFIRSVPTPVNHATGSEVVPGDHFFKEQWALHNTGQQFYCFPWIFGEELCFYVGTNDADIDAPEAWAISTRTPVTVAVIDTGIDYTHPDLAANYDGGINFVAPGTAPFDDHGHGTHVSGTIAAALNNLTGDPAEEEGVVGVAPNARILAYKVCTADGQCDDFLIEQAIAAAVAAGARVINMSLGGPDYSLSMNEAVQDAWNAGLVIVAGAGNDGNTTRFYPAAYDNVVSVGAFDEDDRRTAFSNYGSWVDISAPGNVILSSYPMAACAIANVPGDTGCYTWLSGTSMATPHVSGAAALVWSRGDVTTNQQVVAILLDSADPGGVDAVRLDSWTIHGGLNLHNALSFGFTNLPPIASAGPDQTVRDAGGDGGELVALNGSASSDADGTIVGYEWREGSDVLSFVASPSVFLSVGTHTLTLQVTDDRGSTGSDSVVVTVNRNQPPTANAGPDQTATDTGGDGAETVILNGSASADADGSIVGYEWREGTTVIAVGASPSVSLAVGTHILTLRVTDNDGATATDSMIVTVSPKPGPTTAHIGDLDGSSAGNKSNWTAVLTVTVHHTDHGVVGGAIVTGTWSGGAAGPGTCTTGSNGTCVVVASNLRKKDGVATFTVTGVAASGLAYVSAHNHEPDGDSTGTAISIVKP
jgi:thermitase